MLLSVAVDNSTRKSEVLFSGSDGAEANWPTPGSIFSFVPADGASRAGAVAQQLSRTLTEGLGGSVLLADFDRRAYSVWSANEPQRRLDGRTWGAFVSQVDGIEVLNAREVHARQLAPLLEYAREHYRIVCADLTEAKESHALEVLLASEAIFLVSSSRHASLEGVCEKTSWLRQIDLGARCALLLDRDPNGVSPREAEEITGLPLCSLVESASHIQQLASWLMACTDTAEEAAEEALAIAV
jgi:hypothetical protein